MLHSGKYLNCLSQISFFCFKEKFCCLNINFEDALFFKSPLTGTVLALIIELILNIFFKKISFFN